MDAYNTQQRIEAYLTETAKRDSSAIAISTITHSVWRNITYSQLIQQANAMCAELQKHNITSGERVILLSRNSIEAVAALIGIWLAKASAVLVDPDLPESEIAAQIKTADSRLMINQSGEIKILDHQSKTIFKDTDELIAALLFTSGTTSNAKAVMLSHSNFIYLMQAYQQKKLGKAGDCVLTILPLFHVAGLFCSVIEPLFLGFNIIFFDTVDADLLQRAFQEKKPNLLMSVPKLLEILDQKILNKVRKYGIFSNILLKFFKQKIKNQFGGKLQAILCGSAALSPDIQKRFLSYGFNVLCAYGLTETCGPICIADTQSFRTLNAVGLCLNPADLKIESSGEIIYKGPALMQGYFRDQTATDAVIQNGFFHTQDLGYFDKNKNLHIIGRKNDLIILSDGRKAMPEAIEEKYAHIENISDFAVFPEKINGTNRVSLAFVPTDNTDAAATRDKIYRHAASLKSPYQVAHVYITEKIPRSNTLKVKRHALKDTYYYNNNNNKLIQIFKNYLPHYKNNIMSETYFVELGIDSLMAADLCHIINKNFNAQLTPTLFWFYPTIAELHDYLTTQKNTQKEKIKISAQNNRNNDIAIIAIDAYFPGGSINNHYFWGNLINQKDCITDVPPSRWDAEKYYDEYMLAPGKINNKMGGFIDLPTDFNPATFNIKPRVAACMDPQQKILLMRVNNLLSTYSNNSNNNINLFQHSNTGFYLGAGFSDFMIDVAKTTPDEKINPYTGIGSADFSLTARVAYHFGLTGPAMVIKTACSSSLVAVHLAYRALQNKECDMAIAGGINMLLIPEMSICLTKGGFLSPDARCKTFDNTANGYVRSEGCGLVLLKRYDDAIKDKDTILAVIAGSAINQDGASNGFTAPNGQAQINCYNKALCDANISADQIQFIEAHGTGTQLGDAIEMQSIQAIYDVNRNQNNPLYVGAVKSNIGHAESAAGIAGLIKTIQILQHQIIPANLHYQYPNEHISFENSAVVLPTEKIVFKNKKLQYAAVSSFGIAGTNAHMILKI